MRIAGTLSCSLVNGRRCYGIQEENGQIVTAETLIQLFNKKFIKTES